LQNVIKNNLCKVSRQRARDRERNASRPRARRDLRPSRPRLQKTGLETSLETETKSRDSITGYHFCLNRIVLELIIFFRNSLQLLVQFWDYRLQFWDCMLQVNSGLQSSARWEPFVAGTMLHGPEPTKKESNRQSSA